MNKIITLILIALLTFTGIGISQTPPPSCTITGLIINPSTDQPYINGYLYFNTSNLGIQTIDGSVMQPLQFTARTNTTGLITPPIVLPQGLKVCIAMGGPAYPGVEVQIPNTPTGDFYTILSNDQVATTTNLCTINANVPTIIVF